MGREARISVFRGIMQQRCPRCREGRIFRRSILLGFPPMQERCAVCGLKFEREQGYFLGAMYFSYLLALAATCVIGLFLWLGLDMSFQRILVWSLVLFVPFIPVITLISRVIWIYFDQAVDPESGDSNQR